ncbi:response regulator [Candidatus Saccharibacteria bacterium]|nr:response regulator [Candidatus Saccharibacteria bacterium]
MAKIAVIEDDQPIREMYELKLKKSGFDVQVASDGEEGLRLVEQFRPELILLDLRMPIMDGVEMLKRLREKDWGGKILVIILTNISQEGVPMELRLLDVKRYLVKAHYTPQQVLSIVTDTLDRYTKKIKSPK